jgi:hypothetical protein
MAEGDWWFDLKTHTVVPDNNETKITDRLGPYKTRSATRSGKTIRAGTTISDRSIAQR